MYTLCNLMEDQVFCFDLILKKLDKQYALLWLYTIEQPYEMIKTE
jgi:hypothetical protein